MSAETIRSGLQMQYVLTFTRHISRLRLHRLSTFEDMSRYPSLREVLLQPRHLRQTARVEDGGAHALLLVVRVDAVLIRVVGAVGVGGDREALGLDAHDLGNGQHVTDQSEGYTSQRTYLASQICRFLGGSKELCRLLTLHVAHLCEVEVAHARATPYYPVSVILAQSQQCGYQQTCAQ
jgi:hypothetical protein